jgi:hypothetical protein
VPLTALHLDLIQQLQASGSPRLQEFADLIEMAMDQKQIIRAGPLPPLAFAGNNPRTHCASG